MGIRTGYAAMATALLALAASPAAGQSIPKPIPKPKPRPAPSSSTPRPPAPRVPAPRPRQVRPADDGSPPGGQSQSGWTFQAKDDQNYFADQAEAQTEGNYGTLFSLVLRCEAPGRIISVFGHHPGIGQAYINTYGERAINAYLDGIVNPANVLVAYSGGKVTARVAEEADVPPAVLSAIAAADRLQVTGGRSAMPFSGAGSARAIASLADACGVSLATGGKVTGSGPARAVAVRRPPPPPAYPEIAPDIPPEFAAGTLQLKRSGGCRRMYGMAQKGHIAIAINESDWNGAARKIVELGCSTNIAWFSLGVVAERFGKFDAAQAYYTKAYELSFKPSLSNIFRICADVKVENPCLSVDVPMASLAALKRLQQGAN